MKLSIKILIIFLLIATPSLAFKDVPEKHWAEKYINKLVSLGVTQGYPDGTYRGKDKIDRYQVASFLNNLAKELGHDPSTIKLIAELKTELAVQKYRIENPQNPTLSGKLEGNLFISQTNEKNLFNNYRAIFDLTKKYDKTTNFNLKLDTLDQGFNSPNQRNITTELFEINARFKYFELGFGPRDIIQSNTLIPYYNGKVFRKTQPKIIAKVANNHVKMEAGYTILNNSANGLVSDQDITLGLGYSLAMARIHFVRGSDQDIRGELKISSKPLMLEIGAGSGKTAGLYVGLETRLKPIRITYKKVGSQFVASANQYCFLPLNLIDKYVLPGTSDIGFEYKQPLTENITLKALVDIVLAGNSEISRTSELDLIFSQSKKAKTSLFYRNLSTTTTRSDMLGLGLEMVL